MLSVMSCAGECTEKTWNIAATMQPQRKMVTRNGYVTLNG